MPIFSLPGGTGIGTLGREAYHFVDFLEKGGQSLWQILGRLLRHLCLNGREAEN